ncbi:hypothetical protein [Pseudomonas aeruginosa]|uniref:hypothetical protein n=1 Tax=Pseudomonas aeruginosa TaxID=287 RepID=UPI0011520EA1|nr:hypothetical protein [Pseudomonas aeruginosa]MDH1421302.1 hypothetical protein [Pseudomonas aeruginosa]TQH48084.1 hypothetical protein FLI59_32675 [Pseudomonas aeruginosa]UZV40049.1 hypothetical protein [Pseudomonas phage IR-QUMS-PaBa1-GHS-2021]
MNVQLPRSVTLDAYLQPDGTLMLGPGQAKVTINYHSDPQESINACIVFGGAMQAIVTFDETGQTPVSYTLLNPGGDYTVEQSVLNILSYFGVSAPMS